MLVAVQHSEQRSAFSCLRARDSDAHAEKPALNIVRRVRNRVHWHSVVASSSRPCNHSAKSSSSVGATHYTSPNLNPLYNWHVCGSVLDIHRRFNQQDRRWLDVVSEGEQVQEGARRSLICSNSSKSHRGRHVGPRRKATPRSTQYAQGSPHTRLHIPTQLRARLG